MTGAVANSYDLSPATSAIAAPFVNSSLPMCSVSSVGGNGRYAFTSSGTAPPVSPCSSACPLPDAGEYVHVSGA
eukprot:3939179-Rhodomonas_salina.2